MASEYPRQLADVVGVGTRWGRLTVIEEGESYLWRGRFSRRRWHCICDCGKEASVREDRLRSGLTISCGCARDESTRERFVRHGARIGGARTPEYQAWQEMRRNFGPDAVVLEWRQPNGMGFCNFVQDVGLRDDPSHVLRRKNAQLPFGPGNCYWSKKARRQGIPRRFVTIDGELLTLAAAAQLLGISYATLSKRVQRGRPATLALGAGPEPDVQQKE